MERDFGIDLYKVFSMLLVLVLHILGQGGVKGACGSEGMRAAMALILNAGAYCSVNCYALASGYVGWKSRHRFTNLALLWLKVLFYSIGITCVTFLVQPQLITAELWKKSVFPVMSGTYWYFTSYVVLFLLMPLINQGILHIEQKKARQLLISLFTVFTIGLIFFDQGFHVNNGYSVWWLMLLYILGAYIGKFHAFSKISRMKAVAVYFLMILINISWKYGCLAISGMCQEESAMQTLFQDLSGRLIKYNSTTIVIEAVCLLIIFRELHVPDRVKKIISTLAPLTFGVYIIHLHPVIWDNVMKHRFDALAKLPVVFMVIAIPGCAAGVFLICSSIDFIREGIFRKLRVKERLISMETKME